MFNKCLSVLLLLFLFGVSFNEKACAVIDTNKSITKETSYIDKNANVEEFFDPFESFNRVVFEVNLGLDIIFIKPLSKLYTTLFPSPIRKTFSNIIQNAASPLTFIHDVVQLKAERASDTFFRFLINSTVGFAGIFDVASEMGIQYHREDFGQSMANYGISGGPYLMLPVLGPSNFRDLIGRVGDGFINPLRHVLCHNDLEEVFYGQLAVNAIDSRTNVMDLTDRINKKPDPYKQYRSLYLQNRNYRINDREIDTSDLPGADE